MICVRFNKSRGQPGRGGMDHVWRVFDGPKEYVVKHIYINVPSKGAKTGEDWSICCEGRMVIDKESSTITIEKE